MVIIKYTENLCALYMLILSSIIIDGGFFVFGDVSVKLEGQFRLKFSMFEISKFGATNLKSIYSNVFQVYPSKSFTGMLESTFLSRSFSDQGVRIRIRKEHRVQM